MLIASAFFASIASSATETKDATVKDDINFCSSIMFKKGTDCHEDIYKS